MARKRLTKGTNALRVEERIARVPADLAAQGSGSLGVFESLKALEGISGEERRAAAQKPKAPRGKAGPEKAESARPLGPYSFTKAERRAIVLSCTEYRNRLPTYLMSAMREVELIDSILRKCEHADRDSGSA